jgi:hypothetical protein
MLTMDRAISAGVLETHQGNAPVVPSSETWYSSQGFAASLLLFGSMAVQ